MSDRTPEAPFIESTGARQAGPANPYATALLWSWCVGIGLGFVLLIAGGGVGSVVVLICGGFLLAIGFMALFVHIGVKAVLWKAP